MRPYIYLIEVGPLAGRWSVVESTSKGTTREVSNHRFYFMAFRSASKLSEKQVQTQGDNLRLELHCYDRDYKMVKRLVYGRDPRSVS